MPDITPGYTFSSGEQNVTHTKLNNAAAGTINTTFLSGKGSAGADPSTAFEILLRDTALDTYKKTTIAALLDHSSMLASRTAKTVPVAADAVLIADSAAGNALKQMTAANLLTGAAAFAGVVAAGDKLPFYDISGTTLHSITVEALISLLAANTNPLPAASEFMVREGAGVVTRVSLTRLIEQATTLAAPISGCVIPISDGAYKKIAIENLIAGLAASLTSPAGTELMQVYDAGTLKKTLLSDLRAYFSRDNIVQGTLTASSQLNPAGSWTDTGVTVNITPRHASNKVLVRACLSVDIQTNTAHFKLVRGSTDIGVGDAASNRVQCTASMEATTGMGLVLEWLDSPATTSATTYKVQVKQSSGAVNINRTNADTDSVEHPRAVSVITCQEVYV